VPVPSCADEWINVLHKPGRARLPHGGRSDEQKGG